MITADQILCHLIGDYVIQSDWMANEKTKKLWVALVHAASYAIPFIVMLVAQKVPLSRMWLPLLVIIVTHAAIDRWRLARYLCWIKNVPSPQAYWTPWSECAATGYHKDKPIWLTCWLLFITDNTVHLLINGAALKFL